MSWMTEKERGARGGAVRRGAAIAGAAAIVWLAVATGFTQTPAAGYRAPRAAGGRPDLNGIWQAMNTANWDLEDHTAAPGPVPELGALYAVPPGLGVVEGGSIPYQPWAAEKKKQNFANRLKLDPELRCYLTGVPRTMYLPYPFQIVQGEQWILMKSEYQNTLRTIYMTDHQEAPADTWMGWSNGRWEGDTLVIETTGFVENDTLGRVDTRWLDRAGNFFSGALKVTERITRVSPERLQYEATLEDPKVFTRPWKISMPLYRRAEPNMRLLEYGCVEFVEELIYGHLSKRP
jgi:hypothetical protein